jgi:hypothetical protein
VTVLILAQEYDPSADLMVRAIQARDVLVFRLDTAWFPAALDVDAEFDGHGWAELSELLTGSSTRRSPHPRPAPPARSGRATHARPMPRLPTLPALNRAAFRRPVPPVGARRIGRLCGPLPALAFAFDAGPSWLGSADEFEESRPAARRSTANSTRMASISFACSVNRTLNTETNAANSSYEGGTGDSDTPHNQT